MLRVTSQNDASAACRYFDPSGHDYFLGDQEKAGQWGGRGAAMLGLAGEVAEVDFRALSYNRDPRAYRADRLTDRKVTRIDQANRRVGYDFTFSVPKSVTLAYELLQDDDILAAFRESVAETMADIEGDALARDGRGGQSRTLKPGNLTHATFVHRSSRPAGGVPDCQLHAHVFVFNVARHGGRWTAVELGEVKADAPYYEALASARLAKKLSGLGYGIRRQGKFFEVEGVSEELIGKFSTRRNLIDKLAEERGVTNPDYKAELGGKTREHKLPGGRSSPAQLRAEWLSRLSDSERHALTHLPGQTSRLPTAREAAAYALAHAFEREAVVPERKVYEHALRFGVGSVDVDSLRREFHRQGLITKGDRATTREMLELEAGVIRFAAEGRGTQRAAGRRPPGRSPVEILGTAPTETATLNAGQQAAIRHALKSKDRVTLIGGRAGVCKTTALEGLAAELRASGVPVRAIAPTSKAAEELRGVDPESDTLARFLLDDKMQESARGGWVVLDELSLAGVRDVAKLVKALDRVDARLLGVGDPMQHHGVGAGMPFNLWTKYSGVKPAEISEVVRQRGDYKKVSEHLGRHDTAAALDLLDRMGHVHECDDATRVEMIADRYVAAVKAKQSVLVVSPTNAEADAVSAAIRGRLKEAGVVRGEEREFTRLVPLHQTEAERGDIAPEGAVAQFHRATGKHKPGDRVAAGVALGTKKPATYATYRPASISLAQGDAIRVTANGKDKSGRHKLKNGGVYAVAGFTRGGDIKLGNGWVLDKSFGHWRHDYAGTSHASQGRTVDVVLVSESSNSFAAAGAEQVYVSVSRGKREAHVFTDDAARLREAVSRSRAKGNASDLVDLKPVRPLLKRAQFMVKFSELRGRFAEKVSQLTTKKERHREQQEMDR